jgi:hypothetical protein
LNRRCASACFRCDDARLSRVRCDDDPQPEVGGFLLRGDVRDMPGGDSSGLWWEGRLSPEVCFRFRRGKHGPFQRGRLSAAGAIPMVSTDTTSIPPDARRRERGARNTSGQRATCTDDGWPIFGTASSQSIDHPLLLTSHILDPIRLLYYLQLLLIALFLIYKEVNAIKIL